MIFHLCSLDGRVVLSPEPIGVALDTIEAEPEMFDWVFRLIVTSDSGIVTSDSDDRDHPDMAGWSTTRYGLYFEPLFRSPTR